MRDGVFGQFCGAVIRVRVVGRLALLLHEVQSAGPSSALSMFVGGSEHLFGVDLTRKSHLERLLE